MAALHKRDYRRLSLPSGGSMPCDPDEAAALQALQALLAMTLPERIAAVIADLESRTDRFACVEAHELAEALGIEDAWAPGGDWSFERRADDLSLEEYAQRHSTASEMLDWLSPTELRAKTLAKRAAEFDAGDLEDFGFLSREERATIKRAIDRLLLDWNWGNGQECGIRKRWRLMIRKRWRVQTRRLPFADSGSRRVPTGVRTGVRHHDSLESTQHGGGRLVPG